MLTKVIYTLFILNPVLGQYCQYSNESATANQIVLYKQSTEGYVSCLTTSTGRLVDKESANEVINDDLIYNVRFMESMTSLVREPVRHRVVHAKGTGAYGYFEVTHDVSDIISVAMFNGIGKKTPLTIRFSNNWVDFGGIDTARDLRGFAIKFDTPEGIFDLSSLSIGVFAMKDPIKFPSFTHSNARNPQTNKFDKNMVWDYTIHNPESVNCILRIFSDQGIPSSYTKMSGYPIHTFSFCNTTGEPFYGRFIIKPDSGEENLSSADAKWLGGENPDYHAQDLYDRIARGETPSWTLYVQPLTEWDVENAIINVFDTTLALDPTIYTPRPIGKIYLNCNPINFMRDIEPLAFSVRNLVPGISGMDSMFKARTFNCLDAQNQRLGVNHNEIFANRPTAVTKTYYRGGFPPSEDDDNSPNYYPNSFNGPVPCGEPLCPKSNRKVYVDPKPTNFEQASQYFEDLQNCEKERLVENLVTSLKETTSSNLKDKAVNLFTQINNRLGLMVRAGLKFYKGSCEESNCDTRIIHPIPKIG